MDVFMGVPRMVWPGPRTSVILDAGLGKRWHLYTWDAWIGSLCERAYQLKISVTLETKETPWGQLITRAALTDLGAHLEAVSALDPVAGTQHFMSTREKGIKVL